MEQDNQESIISSTPFAGFNSKATASCAYLCSEGEFLFLCRSQNSSFTSWIGKWSVPGGKLEGMETLHQGLIRELKEETGIDIKEQEILSSKTFYVRNERNDYILHNFFIKLNQRPLVHLNSEHTQFKWLCWHEARTSLPLIPNHLGPDIFEEEKKRIIQRDSIFEEISKYSLGLKRKHVELVEFNPSWIQAVTYLTNILNNQVSSILKIEHVGSTSVPGCIAKPILDLLVILTQDAEISKVINEIEQLGFIYKGDGIARVHGAVPDPNRHFFAFYDYKLLVDCIHLHVVREDSPEIDAKLSFRDILRSNSDLVDQYNDLKRSLKNSNLSRKAYSSAKTDFILRELVQ